MEIPNPELKALINLLDDPDAGVYRDVRARLVSIGPSAIPVLESTFFDTLPDALTLDRIQDIIHHIEFSICQESLTNWAHNGAVDLVEGSLIIARHQYADLDELAVANSINKVKKDVWLELSDRLTALEKVRVLNHIMFDIHGFAGNNKDFHAPQNSYLNVVCDSKRGNPLSLSILYLTVAQQLGMPIFGLNLPELFVLGYKDLHEDEPSAMLFYINPFSRGAIFGFEELNAFIRKTGTEPSLALCRPCQNIDILGRMTNNLINSYQKLGNLEKVEEIRMLQTCLTNGTGQT